MAKNQPGVLARQDKIKKARKEYMDSPEAAEKFKGALMFTPYATYADGKSMVDNIKKGDYISAAVDGGFAALGAIPFAKMLGKGIKSGYQGLKGLFQGPLSPQYNYKGTMKKTIKEGLSKFFDHPMNVAVRKNKPEFKDVEIYYTGQNPAVAKEMMKGKTKDKVFFSDNPEVAKEYAGPQGVIMGFGARTPIGGKRSIIDKNMGYAGGQTQFVLDPSEAAEFMKNPNFQMPFSIFSDPKLTRR